MEIDVYDTYAKSRDGSVLHFDVFVKRGADKDLAFKYAKAWLLDIGEDSEGLDQSRCRFCHFQPASTDVQKAIEKEEHYILQMEGCPNPVR